MRVLFICLGNICRSPSAEGVFKSIVESRGSSDKFTVDSAGIIGAHAGERADARMRSHAEKRGYDLQSRSRRFYPEQDFSQFDMVVGMDHQNINDLRKVANSQEELDKIHYMTDFCQTLTVKEVPDPYYGGSRGFEEVLDILEDACEGLYIECTKSM